ncbi:aminoglycoside phosphotransferase family protein [Patescibacteria group bacterium]
MIKLEARDSSLSAFDKIAQEISGFSDKFGLPEISSVEKVSGGVAHHVYRLETGQENFFLKIRGDRFSTIPEIEINPKDIEFEHRSLELLGSFLPDNIVKPVFFDKERNFMILQDAMPNGETLETEFLNNNVSGETTAVMGELLREIHERTSDVVDPVRKLDDRDFYDLKLQHRFSYRKDPVLNSTIESLQMRNRQIVLGDFSPKNVAVNDGGEHLVLFDLEDVHQGNPVVDVAFGAGHIIVHSLDDSEKAINLTEHFLKAYGENSQDHTLKALTIGVLMYRLDSVIPYPVQVGERKMRIINQAESLLADFQLPTINWHDLINRLLVN